MSQRFNSCLPAHSNVIMMLLSKIRGAMQSTLITKQRLFPGLIVLNRCSLSQKNSLQTNQKKSLQRREIIAIIEEKAMILQIKAKMTSWIFYSKKGNDNRHLKLVILSMHYIPYEFCREDKQQYFQKHSQPIFTKIQTFSRITTKRSATSIKSTGFHNGHNFSISRGT